MKPAVYLLLGLPDSGRRALLLELVEGGLPEAAVVEVHHAADAGPEGAAALARLAQRPGVVLAPYVFADGQFVADAGADEAAEPDAVFFLTDGRASLIDQLEVFPAWLQARGWEIGRVLLVAHGALAARHPEVAEWHLIATHFADVVLLNRRDATSQAWAQEFHKKLQAAHYPCLIEYVKRGKVENAPLVLFPEARRLTMIFDDVDPLDDIDWEEENLPDEPFALVNKPDPYFERMPTGLRAKPVPDVSKYLEKT